MKNMALTAGELRDHTFAGSTLTILELTAEFSQAYATFFDMCVSSFAGIIGPRCPPQKVIQAFPGEETVFGPSKGIEKLVLWIDIHTKLLENKEQEVENTEDCEEYCENNYGNETHPNHASNQRHQLFVIPGLQIVCIINEVLQILLIEHNDSYNRENYQQ